ncbi:hypothetical protein WJX81_005512 [Elliptochloris bilobata]|uniref:MYND-type domain-containing protein n=1 Tax=Elliptochloris bilobata TaxID=381761 RepID=A0AAW1S8M2_9CHLO
MTCWACLRPLPPARLACGACALARYCSARCRAQHSLKHACECGAPWPALLPARAVLAARLARFQAAEEAAGRPARHLQHHLGALAGAEALPRAAAACLAAACSGLMPGRVLEALCAVDANALAVVPPLYSRPEQRLALAVYGISSLLNHACAPSVGLRFRGGALTVRALRAHAPGDRLRHCYGPQAGEHTLLQRQQLLGSEYHFDCRCAACVDGGAAERDAALVGLRCSDCGGAVPPWCALPAGRCSLHRLPGALPGGGACSSCGRRMRPGEQAATLRELQAADKRFQSAISGSRVEDSLRDIDACLKVQQRALFERNQVLGRTLAARADLLATAGRQAEAAQAAGRAAAVVAAAFGEGAVQTALARRDLAGLLARTNTAAAAELARRAAQVLRVHLGDAEPEAS